MFAFDARLSRPGHRRSTRRSPHDLHLEALEARFVPAGISLLSRTISVIGYDEADSKDTVVISRDDRGTPSTLDDRLTVTLSNSLHGSISRTFKIFTASGFINGIEADLYAGADELTNHTALPCDADGGAGNDTLNGGAGADTLFGGLDHDRLFGNAGADQLDGGWGVDRLYGGADEDRLTSLGGDYVLDGGPGLDVVLADCPDELILSDSKLTRSSGAFDLLAGIEAAELTGGGGIETFDARAFTGTLTVRGGEGGDYIYGGKGVNHLYGGDGNDYLDCTDSTSVNYLHGERHRDTLIGGTGRDYLYGGSHDDRLSGNAGDDRLYGEGGEDTLHGGAGNDFLHGGREKYKDRLTGGSGADVMYLFTWYTNIEPWNPTGDKHCDVATDEEPADDVYVV